MTEIYLGEYGAKRVTYNDHNLRELLAKLMDKYPRANKEKIRSLLIDEVSKRGNEDYIRSCIEYACTNAVTSVFRKYDRPVIKQERHQHVQAVQERKRELEVKVEKVVQRRAQVILMSLEMPNGKTLGECTGTYCQKLGGWYAAVGAKVKSKKVADVLSEQELRKMHKGVGK
jgi:hypothetical protein